MTTGLQTFVDEQVAVLKPLEKKVKHAYWKLATTGETRWQEEATRLNIEIRTLLSDSATFARLQALRSGAATDGLLARQAELLALAYQGNQLDPATIADISQREMEIANIFNTFRSQLRGRKVTDNELKDILRDSDDLALRREAWEASKQIGPLVAGKVRELARRRNAAARTMGFTDFYTMRLQLQELDEAELFETLGNLEHLSQPLYANYLAGLNRSLSRRFGLDVAGLRPWHYGDPFFQEAPATDPRLAAFLKETFAGQNLEALTAEFYAAIGLEIGDILQNSDLYEREGKEQHAFCLDMDREGDIRVLSNNVSNHVWMDTMLHEFGHAVYDKYIGGDLPYILREPAHTNVTEAIALLMGRLATDPAWLVTYAGAAPQEVEAIRPLLEDSLRSRLLIFTRWVLVMVHFERALYQDPEQDLDRLWWDIVERFQMIRRPDGRQAPDWATKIHLGTAPVDYHNYLLGEMIASQLRHHILTTALGNDSEADARFVRDRAVGDYLKERLFSLGSSLHWQAALRQVTGERLNPRYFVEQLSA